MSAIPRPPRPFLLLLDLALVGWIAAWILLGVALAREARGLTRLSTTLILAGGALEQTGDLLGTVQDLPLVGDDVGELSERVRRTGRSAIRNARASRESVENVSTLLGISIALIPTIPIAAVYMPVRLAWRREGATVRRGLAAGDERLDRYLAWRAVQNLPYERLLEVSADPWADLVDGRHRALADAELARLRLRRPRA